ncbi:MAG: magnesium transporter [Candidatus Aenigmatarchaeota archaeon]
MVEKKLSPKTAESLMVKEIPIVSFDVDTDYVKKKLIKEAKKFEVVDYVYVVDKENVLCGVFSIKELLRTKGKLKVQEIMKKDLVFVRPKTHQERIVYIALSKGIKTVPVVDEKGHLLGIVPYDTILQIFNKEVREDIFKFGGLFHKIGKEYTTIKSPAKTMVKSRLPWLLIGIFGGVIAASIVTFFESILSVFIALASFIPVMVYITDSIGTQSETLIVRTMALDPKFSVKSYMIRELKVTFVLSSLCSLFLAFIALAGWRNFLLSCIVGIALFVGMFAGVLISSLLPLFFRRIGKDPAIATGPLATLTSDIITLAIYFLVAQVFLGFANLSL